MYCDCFEDLAIELYYLIHPQTHLGFRRPAKTPKQTKAQVLSSLYSTLYNFYCMVGCYEVKDQLVDGRVDVQD